MRNDTDQSLVVDNRHAGNTQRARQADDFTNADVGTHRDRIAHDAALELLDLLNLPRLFLRRHVLVDDADAAFLGHRDRQAEFGHRIHCCGQQRNVQPDLGGQLGAEIDFAGQDVRIGGLQEYVVKRQGFAGNSHQELWPVAGKRAILRGRHMTVNGNPRLISTPRAADPHRILPL